MNKKMAEILTLDGEELTSSIERAREELFKLRLGRSTQQLTNVMQIRQKRREIARLMTAITQKQTQKAAPAKAAAKSTAKKAPAKKAKE